MVSPAMKATRAKEPIKYNRLLTLIYSENLVVTGTPAMIRNVRSGRYRTKQAAGKEINEAPSLYTQQLLDSVATISVVADSGCPDRIPAETKHLLCSKARFLG
jgi:hypothetical protein